jgi:cell division septum initiation protein DivIVA
VVDPGTPGTGGGDGRAILTELAERLEQARFTVAFRGFEPREVHALLAEVAGLLKGLAGGEAGGRLDETTRARRIATAQDEADEIVRKAREEAEQILDAAMRQAAELRKEAAAFREQARATVLEGIRDANLLMQRARDERRSDESAGS